MSIYHVDNQCYICKDEIPDVTKALFVHECHLKEIDMSPHGYDATDELRRVVLSSRKGRVICKKCWALLTSPIRPYPDKASGWTKVPWVIETDSIVDSMDSTSNKTVDDLLEIPVTCSDVELKDLELTINKIEEVLSKRGKT